MAKKNPSLVFFKNYFKTLSVSLMTPSAKFCTLLNRVLPNKKLLSTN